MTGSVGDLAGALIQNADGLVRRANVDTEPCRAVLHGHASSGSAAPNRYESVTATPSDIRVSVAI